MSVTTALPITYLYYLITCISYIIYMCILSKAHFVQCRVTKLVPCVYLFAAITHFVHQFHRDFVSIVLSSQFLQLTSAYSGPNAAQSTEGTTIIIALCYINVHKICHCFHHGNFIVSICHVNLSHLIVNYVSRVSVEIFR